MTRTLKCILHLVVQVQLQPCQVDSAATLPQTLSLTSTIPRKNHQHGPAAGQGRRCTRGCEMGRAPLASRRWPGRYQVTLRQPEVPVSDGKRGLGAGFWGQFDLPIATMGGLRSWTTSTRWCNPVRCHCMAAGRSPSSSLHSVIGSQCKNTTTHFF